MKSLDIQHLLMVAFVFVLAGCGGGGGGGGGAPVTTNNDGATAPTLQFSASDTNPNSGQEITLQWQSGDASNCTAGGAWAGSKSLSGSQSVGPITADSNFTLSCSGNGGTTVREIAIRLTGTGDLALELVSSQKVVEGGNTVDLTWSADGAERCDASGAWTGSYDASGTVVSNPISADSTFKLTCFAQEQSAVALVTVYLYKDSVSWQPPSENVDGSQADDLSHYTVYWGSTTQSYTENARVELDSTSIDVTAVSGDHYYAVTATDLEGNESGYSNEVYRPVP